MEAKMLYKFLGEGLISVVLLFPGVGVASSAVKAPAAYRFLGGGLATILAPVSHPVVAVGCVYPVVEIYMFVDKDQYTKRSELSVGACYLVY